ncbi:MAG TPA: PAS domain-containing protein, partial [Nannocystis sp.]
MNVDAWDGVPVPMIGWREDGRVVAVNTAAVSALGRSREDLLATSYWELTLSGQKQRELALVQRCELPFGKEFLRASGEPVTVQVIGCTRLPDGDGHVCAFTV